MYVMMYDREPADAELHNTGEFRNCLRILSTVQFFLLYYTVHKSVIPNSVTAHASYDGMDA